MKKFLALALALVMALALAAPAMAFTSVEVEDEYLPSLSVELVEFEDNGWFGIVGAAPSDRGYAKNEIVAFIVTMEVAKDQTNGSYNYLTVTGENVKFLDEDKQVAGGAPALFPFSSDMTKGFYADLPAVAGKAKLQWLAFAKVTGDDASITAELAAKGAAASVKFNASGVLLVEDADENVYRVEDFGSAFVVYAGADRVDDKALFQINVDEDGKSTSLYVFNGTNAYKVLKNNAGDYIFTINNVADIDDPKTDAYKALAKIVDETFADVFGFDYDLLGGVVNKKYFEGLVSYDKISFTADIAPWVAYVQVPDVIVVDPPKTGDATVLVGIVMAIVAAAGVVVFNKVRA